MRKVRRRHAICYGTRVSRLCPAYEFSLANEQYGGDGSTLANCPIFNLMAEPVTILSIINGSLGIALKIGEVVNDLRETAQKFKLAELELQSTIEECRVIQTACGGIEKWARKADITVEQELLERLDQSLTFGVMVMSALETDLAVVLSSSAPAGFLRRSKVVWNRRYLHNIRVE
jgi:hypothetical protein